MRYYQPFPVAIPRFGAGHQRVTHPFATKDAMQAKHPSFDLHVLGTPPAFILSQDQTLRKIFRLFRRYLLFAYYRNRQVCLSYHSSTVKVLVAPKGEILPLRRSLSSPFFRQNRRCFSVLLVGQHRPLLATCDGYSIFIDLPTGLDFTID